MITLRQTCTPQLNTGHIALFRSRRKIVCRGEFIAAVEMSKQQAANPFPEKIMLRRRASIPRAACAGQGGSISCGVKMQRSLPELWNAQEWSPLTGLSGVTRRLDVLAKQSPSSSAGLVPLTHDDLA
jgi:hypothetical protein